MPCNGPNADTTTVPGRGLRNGTPPYSLDLEICRRGGRSFLSRRYFRWPYEIGILTNGHTRGPADDTATLVVQSATSGLISGERLRQRVVVRDEGRVRLIGQGAMPVQQARSEEGSTEDLRLDVTGGSHLEFVSEPRLLFPNSRFSQVTTVSVDSSSGVILVDAVVRHPDAGPVSYLSETRLEFNGDIVAIERMGFENISDHHFGATVLILAVGAFAAGIDWKPWLRRHDSPMSYGAASPLRQCPGVSLRVVADDGRHLRKAIEDALAILVNASDCGDEP